jgi:hypothetical protein
MITDFVRYDSLTGFPIVSCYSAYENDQGDLEVLSMSESVANLFLARQFFFAKSSDLFLIF